MKLIFWNTKAKTVWEMMLFLAFIAPVISPIKNLFGIGLAGFYTYLIQLLACLIILSYDLALRKSRELVELRQSLAKVYVKILQFNLLAASLFYISQLVTCYLFGARIAGAAEFRLTIIILLAKFLILLLTMFLYAYNFTLPNGWPLLAAATLLPLLYHYLIELGPLYGALRAIGSL